MMALKPGHARLPDLLRWGGWWLVLACVLIRCLVAIDPFPHWAIDPGRVVLPITGLTPAASMSVDSVMLLGCGVALIGEVLAGAAVLWLPLLLWALGAIGVMVQAFVMRAGTIDDARIGVMWIAAFAAGLTAMHLCRDERVRRVTLAAMIGLIAMLAAKGALQVFHEHAMTVARYRADREGFLASQGWTPGSASARNFERRLNQPEATGWFGLSNVFATFAATCAVALIGCAALAWREARGKARLADGFAGLLTLGALAAVGALVLAGSKGGYVALGAGLLVLALAWTFRGRVQPRIAGVAAVGIVGVALAAVMVQGILGDRFGDLSVLFRWFYIQGAARAFAENPLFGTGPDGFKDAYMRLKPALSPEEVSSPHSVFFDLVARMGVFGVLWAGLWLRWVYGAGQALVNRAGEPAPGKAKAEGWMVILVAAGPLLVSTWMERAMGSPEQALARVAGLAAWVGVSLSLLMLLRVTRAGFVAIAAGAVTAAVHGQIEVTPLWDSSAAWVCVLLGAAGAGVSRDVVRARRGLIAPGVLIAAALLSAWMGVRPTSRWELALRDGAVEVRPMAEMRAQMAELDGPGEAMARFLQDLARLADTQVPASQAEMDRALARLTWRCETSAAPHLERASSIAERHFPTWETRVRILMEGALAAEAAGMGSEAQELASRALLNARDFARRSPTSSSLGLLGNVEAAVFTLTKEPSHLDQALAAYDAGAKLDPYGLSLPLQSFRALVSANRLEEAKAVAHRLLELNELQRLDQLKQLSPEDQALIDRILAGN